MSKRRNSLIHTLLRAKASHTDLVEVGQMNLTAERYGNACTHPGRFGYLNTFSKESIGGQTIMYYVKTFHELSLTWFLGFKWTQNGVPRSLDHWNVENR